MVWHFDSKPLHHQRPSQKANNHINVVAETEIHPSRSSPTHANTTDSPWIIKKQTQLWASPNCVRAAYRHSVLQFEGYPKSRKAGVWSFDREVLPRATTSHVCTVRIYMETTYTTFMVPSVGPTQQKRIDWHGWGVQPCTYSTLS